MSLPKLFERIFWHNNTTPAVNETNLNAMSKGLSDVDDRLISLGGLIMETVPEIQQDMEILGPAVESIDDNVAAAQASAETAEEQALKSEGYAAGTQDGVEVTSGEYYQNNAKYYAEIANPPIENTVDFTDVITISDAINKAAKDVCLKIEAVQDLHGYNNPWVGGAGKNKWDEDWEVGGINSSDGSNNNSTTNRIRSKNYIPVIPGQSYYCVAPNSVYAFFYRQDKSYTGQYPQIANTITTIPNDVYWIRICPVTDYGTTYKNDIAINYPSTVTTYSPYTNICPITGWTGAKPTVANENLFNGTYDEFVYCPIPKNTQFTASIDASASGVYFGVYDKYKNEIDYWMLSNTTPDGNRKYRVITLAKDVYYVKFYSVQGSNYAVKLGDDKVFSPYATTYTINFGGTRYGGTLDVTSGVLTVDRVAVDLDSLSFGTYNSTNRIYYSSALDTNRTDIIFEDYATTDSISADMPNGSGSIHGGNHRIYIRDMRYNETEFNNATKGNAVYYLATPQTIQLAPIQVYLLYGYNTLFGDCGDISLTYDASGIIHIAEAKLDIDVFKAVTAASSDFADFKSRVAAL